MKSLTPLNLKLVLLLLACVACLGVATNGYGQAVVSLAATGGSPLTVGENVEVSVNIAGGEGVAGYALLLAFDADVLRYISATPGDYLPEGGIWIAPQLSADGSYEVTLITGGETSTGPSVQFGDRELTIEQVLINLQQPSLEGPAVSGEEPPPEELAVPGENPLGISILASSVPDVASDVDGTLVTFTFEVLKANAPTFTLLNMHLSDVEDAALEVTAASSTLILNASDAPVDVNGDGNVNILDLVFVAGQFGAPVTEANRAADVNRDGAINILDLTLIAQHFGK